MSLNFKTNFELTQFFFNFGQLKNNHRSTERANLTVSDEFCKNEESVIQYSHNDQTEDSFSDILTIPKTEIDLNKYVIQETEDTGDLLLKVEHKEAVEYENHTNVGLAFDEDSSKDNANNSLKRKCDPLNWKKNVKKMKRQSGQEYINTAGKKVPKRELKNSCTNCTLKCGNHIPEDERMKIFEYFWMLTDAEKSSFYANHIKELPCKSGKKTSRRKFFREYSLPSKGICYRVCAVFFLNTLDISIKRIQSYFKGLRDT